MDRRVGAVIFSILFLGISYFFEPDSSHTMGLIPIEVQRNLLAIEEVDKGLILKFEELPETFILDVPINNHSWFPSFWNYYRYTKASEPEVIDEEYDFSWELINEPMWEDNTALTIFQIFPQIDEDIKTEILHQPFSSEQLSLKGTVYRTQYQVEKVNTRLGIVTRRFTEDVISSNELYIAIKQ